MNGADNIKFSERIKEYRKENSLTQTELADILFVSKQAISKWENDRSMPDISLYPRIAKMLNISIDQLMGNEKKEKKSKIDTSKHKFIIVNGFILSGLLIIIIISILALTIPGCTVKNNIVKETEKYLKIELPEIEEYEIIVYEEWIKFSNSSYPDEIYYFAFKDEVISVDKTWMSSVPQEMIDAMPIGASEYPYLCDYYKLVNTETNEYNQLDLESERKIQYILYCLQIQNKRLIAIKFEV